MEVLRRAPEQRGKARGQAARESDLNLHRLYEEFKEIQTGIYSLPNTPPYLTPRLKHLMEQGSGEVVRHTKVPIKGTIVRLHRSSLAIQMPIDGRQEETSRQW